MIKMNLLTKQKQTHRLENELMVIRGKAGRRDSWGSWNGQEQSPVFKMDNQQELNCIAQGTVLNVMWQPG